MALTPVYPSAATSSVTSSCRVPPDQASTASVTARVMSPADSLMVAQQIDQTVVTELVVGRRDGFRDAIGETHEPVEYVHSAVTPSTGPVGASRSTRPSARSRIGGLWPAFA